MVSIDRFSAPRPWLELIRGIFGTGVAEGGMVSLAVVEHLDPFEQEQSCFGSRGERRLPRIQRILAFRGCIEPPLYQLRRGFIPRARAGAYAGCDGDVLGLIERRDRSDRRIDLVRDPSRRARLPVRVHRGLLQPATPPRSLRSPLPGRECSDKWRHDHGEPNLASTRVRDSGSGSGRPPPPASQSVPSLPRRSPQCRVLTSRPAGLLRIQPSSTTLVDWYCFGVGEAPLGVTRSWRLERGR